MKGEWDAMEAAPHDGTLVLLRVPTVNELRRHSRTDWPDVTLGYYSERMVVPGWYSLEREDDQHGAVFEIKVDPIGWLPVPK